MTRQATLTTRNKNGQLPILDLALDVVTSRPGWISVAKVVPKLLESRSVSKLYPFQNTWHYCPQSILLRVVVHTLTVTTTTHQMTTHCLLRRAP